MGTTRIKVIDLSSDEKEIKTSRKHAEKLSGLGKAKKAQKTESQPTNQQAEKPASAEFTQGKDENTEQLKPTESITITDSTTPLVPSDSPSVATAPTRKPKRQTHHLGQKYVKAKQLIEDKVYTQNEAFELLPKTSSVKFDPTVEIHLNVADKSIKGSVTFPHLKTVQKEKKYLIFSDEQSTINDKHIIWANEKTVSQIENGALKTGKDFDTVVTTPKFMPALAKVAKILGPKGLMPNPKNGTITEDPTTALDGNKTEDVYHYKTDPTAPIIHAKLGKLSQNSDELKGNLKVLIASIGTSKIKKATLTTSMGPGIRINPAA